MNVGELIDALSDFDPGTGVVIFADPEGLTAMRPESVSEQRDWYGQQFAFISGWSDPPSAREARVLI